MALLTEQLVGRAEELGSLDQVLAELERGDVGAVELIGEPGIGKTRLLGRARRSRGRAGPARPLGLRVRARARPAVLGVRRCAGRVRARARAQSAQRPRRRRTDGARARLPFPVGARNRRRGWRSSTSATAVHRAVRALLEQLANDAAARARARRPPLGGRGVRRAGRRAPAPPAGRGRAHRAGRATAPDAGAAVGGARARPPRGGADANRARRAQPRRGAGATRRRGRARRRDRPLRGERRQSVLSRAARAVARPRRCCAAAVHDETSLAAIGVPSARRRGAQRGARAAVGRAHASSWKGRRWRAIRSSPSWRRPRPRAVRGLGDGRGRRAPATRSRPRPPTCRGASASGTRSCGARSTRRRPAAGGSARTSAAPTRSRSAAPRQRPAPITSSARRARATPTRSPSCARPESEAVRLAPASAAHWFGRRAAPAPADRAGGGAHRASLARAGALTAAGRFADSHAALLEAARDRARGSPALRAQARPRVRRGREPPRAAGASRRTPRGRPRRPARPGVAGGGGADDRARREPRLARAATRRCTSGPSARSTPRDGSETRP